LKEWALRKATWWLGGLAVFIALPIAAIGIGVVAIDPNDYKPDIISAVQDATGRTLSLNGPLRISRSLWPTIEVNDVALANMPGGTRADMARAERIEARLSLPALLWHQIEVVRLTLVGPNILFEQVGGTSNWLLNPPEVANLAPVAAPGTPFRLRIRNVHVQNGMVTTRLPARTRVIGIKSLDLQHHTDGGPLDLAAILVYSDNKPFSLKASAQPTAGIKGPWNTQLHFAAFDTTASATGTTDVSGDYDLQVDAQSGALEALNTLLPEMRLPALHRLTLSAHVTNGLILGDLPVFGKTKLHFDTADISDRGPPLKLNATDISLESADAMASVSSTGQFAGQPFMLKGTFGVPKTPDGVVSVPIDLVAQATASGGKAAGAVNGNVAMQGKLALDNFQFGGLDATATVRTAALASLQPLLATSLPALTDVQFQGRVVIPAKAGSVRFIGAKLQTHEGDIGGDGTIERGADLALKAKLHANRIDIDTVLALAGFKSAAVSERTAGPVIPDTPLPWAALRGSSLDISGSIGTLTYQGQAFQNLDFAVQLKGGRIPLGTLNLSLPGGPLALSVTADASTDAASATLSVHAPRLPLALIARTAGMSDPVQGTAQIDAQLRGNGRSAHDLAASLDGPFSATLFGGQLSNTAFAKLLSAYLDALGIAVPAQGETTLRCLGLVGSVSKGIAQFRTIALDTTYLQMSGVGEVDLGKETVAFKLTPLAQILGSPVSVPVLVEGPFRAIKGRLDATGLDQLGLLIDSLFGGDDPDTCTEAGLVPHHTIKP
jgi:uncharacterized protein involved in outer membrane biogenesis